MDIAFGINSSKANYYDLKEVMGPILSKLNFLPSDFDLNAKLDANIFGKATLDGLKIKTEVQYTDLTAYGENVSAGDFVISMENKVISLRDFTGQKGSGQIKGDFSFDLKSDKMKIDYEWDDIALASFAIVKKAKLNLQGMLSG